MEESVAWTADVHPMGCGEKEIILVGTAHLSRASTDLVERIIGKEVPETVCVELCASRYDSLTQKKRWEETDLIKVIREKKTMLLFANLLLAHFQKRIGARLGIRPGEEILKAIQCAGTSGSRVHLVDRDIRTTLSRAWYRMGLRAKFKLLYQFISSLVEADEISEADIEEMKNKDVLESLLSEMGQALPVVREVLIDERDRYLSHMIRTAPGKKVVAIVGAGHVPGVKRYWDQEIDIEALRQMPPKGRYAGWFKWGFPALIVALFVLGFYTSGTSTGTDMIVWWAITTGALSGLGAAMALGHPLTILSAVLSAPLTTLHPLIAAGWVAGLVEALLGRPKVKDFQNLLEDITSLKGFWKNKITRILLVVIFTNLGASIGTFVAIPLMIKLLA
ncbi:MAG: TraB/GumN family protein [Deltaproteobacteria bacterium]|nr:TraB/GumN family protein [Deltaproteobacteria bacterium]